MIRRQRIERSSPSPVPERPAHLVVRQPGASTRRPVISHRPASGERCPHFGSDATTKAG